MSIAVKAFFAVVPLSLLGYGLAPAAPTESSFNVGDVHKVGELYLGEAKKAGKLKVSVRTKPHAGGGYTTTEVEIDVEAGDSGSTKASAVKDALNAHEGDHVHASQTEDADGNPGNHVHIEATTTDGTGVTSVTVDKDKTRQKVVASTKQVPNTLDSDDFDGDSSEMPPEPENAALVEFDGLPTGYSVDGAIGSYVEVGTARGIARVEILPGEDQSLVIRKLRAGLSEAGIAARPIGPDLFRIMLDPDLDDYLMVDIDDSGMSLGFSIFDPAELD